MSSASLGSCEVKLVYAKLKAYHINIWANVFPMMYTSYDLLCIHMRHHETDSTSRIESDYFFF